MSNLKARVRTAHQSAPSVSIHFKGDEYFKILHDFAAEIRELNPDVEAEAARGDVPQVFYLKLAPKHLPFESSIMLNFFVGEDGVRTSGTVLRSEAELEDHLVAFYQLPAFREALSSISERSRQDITGFLRRSMGDIRLDTSEVFTLPNREFVRLAEAAPGITITLQAQKEPRYYGGALTEAEEMLHHLKKFSYLAVTGYGLRVTDVRKLKGDDWYEIAGVVQPFGKVR